MANQLGRNPGGVQLARTPGGGSSVIADGSVTNAKLANQAARTIKGQPVGGSGAPVNMSPSQACRVLGTALMTEGSALANSNATLTVAGGNNYTLEASTLTAIRTITLGIASATAGEIIRIIRRDTTAFTLIVVDDTAAVLYTFPVSVQRAADFRFDGLHFTLGGHTGIS